VPYGPTGSPVEPARWDTISGRVTDPGGHVTRYWWLNQHRQAHEMQPALGPQVSVRYTSQSQLQKLVQPMNAIDSIAYDASGLPVLVKPAGQLYPTLLRYASGWGTPDSIWDNGASYPTVRRFIGLGGRVDSMCVGYCAPGSGYRTKYWYEPWNRVQTTRDPAGHQVSYDYTVGEGNPTGNLRTVTFPGNRTVTYTYDGYGRVTSIARTGLATQTIEYDLLNRPIRVYDGVNENPTRYEYDLPYDANHHIAIRVTDPKDQVYDEVRNKLGWVAGRKDPAGVWETYQYDRDGLRRLWYTRRGESVIYAYDQLHRLTQKSGDSTTTAIFTYSPDGRVISDSNAYATNWTHLNVRGQPDSVRTRIYGCQGGSCDFWLRYAHSILNGRLDSVYATGGAASFMSRRYSYDWFGTLTDIRLSGTSTTVAPDSEAIAQATTFPGGDVVSQVITALHAPAVQSGSGLYADSVWRAVSYDAVGRVWRQLEKSGVGHLYGYDGLGRLIADTVAQGGTPYCPEVDPVTGAVCTWGGTVAGVSSFQYDAAGNRLDNGGTYDPGNRIKTWAPLGCTFQHDAAGNRTREYCSQRWSNVAYEWDMEGRLLRVMFDRQQPQWLDTMKFHYDALGRLVRKSYNDSVQQVFLWDGQALFAELDGQTGSKVAEYSYYPALDSLHALVTGSTPFYAHTDGLGSVVALTNASQGIERSYRYDAWGNRMDSPDFQAFDRARFKGALWLGPEADLYYMRNRWYDSKTGRFLNEDPIGLAGGINPYTYAGNDPVNGKDPTGLQHYCHDGHWTYDPPPSHGATWHAGYCFPDWPEIGGDLADFLASLGEFENLVSEGRTTTLKSLSTTQACVAAFGDAAGTVVVDFGSMAGTGSGIYRILRGATYAAVGGIGWMASTLNTGIPMAGRVGAMRGAAAGFATLGVGGAMEAGGGSILAGASYDARQTGFTVIGAGGSGWNAIPVVASVMALARWVGECRP
jgi:RHS repeat-associated protein